MDVNNNHKIKLYVQIINKYEISVHVDKNYEKFDKTVTTEKLWYYN